MTFEQFKLLFQQHVADMLKNQNTLFIVDLDKDKLWNTYLDSFPEGTNEIYREKREFDCSCCRHFIKSFGNIVAIKDNAIVTIWDFDTKNLQYQPVIDALAKMVKAKPISDVFVTKELVFGTDSNHELLDAGKVRTWEHFYIELPSRFRTTSTKTIGTEMGKKRDIRNVFKRSLEEISKEAIQTILELIAQNSLYKGDEWEKQLNSFLSLHNEYHRLRSKVKKENWCWSKSVAIGGVIGKIRNHSIGVLLTDITDGMELDAAVRRYEKIVAPINYKRPKTIFSEKDRQKAEQKAIELGIENSFGRRHATIEDINIKDILFANKDVAKRMAGSAFDSLKKEVTTSDKKFDRVEEVKIDDFVQNILPSVERMEIYFENKHTSNLMSLVAPEIKGSKPILKWDNNFSWAYTGNITDSMKERVKSAGGNVDGVLRFSIMWNDGDNNQNDFDAHCREPRRKDKRIGQGTHIFFENRAIVHLSSGMLDVDITAPGGEVAVENIIYTDLNKMPPGKYKFYVHNYSYNGGRTGFAAEIEFDGQIYSYEYSKELRQDEIVEVAEVELTEEKQFKIIKSLPSTTASKIIWDMPTNQFHPVSTFMLSPNYWEGEKGTGNKHYFFIAEGFKNESCPNGFFNEFLREDLMEHKRVFEALGSKMRVEDSDSQISGLGFSSTKRNALICKVEGSFTRTLKITF